jgi:hypothetical protein
VALAAIASSAVPSILRLNVQPSRTKAFNMTKSPIVLVLMVKNRRVSCS